MHAHMHTYLLHGLMCNIAPVQWLHYFIVMFMLTLEVDCSTPCSPILCQQ